MANFLKGIVAGMAVIFAVACSSSSSTADSSEMDGSNQEKVGEELRVMAYNIHHANPPSKPEFIDLNAIVETIRNEDPDLVALQEVDFNTERSGAGNQAEQIASLLNMNYFFGKAIDYEGGEYGVAILSKFPLAEEKVERLPTQAGTNGEPRVLVTAKIVTPKGNTIRFGSTHLDAQREPTNRLLQIKKIVELAQDEELPFIIAGDFNAVQDSEVMNIFTNDFGLTCTDCPFTISTDNPVKTIDFIGFNPASGKFKVKNHHVVKQDYASDHFPIVSNLVIVQ
ncbi:endonuclease/exonuclease/phosphatase family protein [Antarcticibacterium sp. 1MA-6-2]|uniref:endonuclease/exonuclease/phosphatase family protein n=1 Tax=Antarcticibacterium sp. 1MA-6-2 TaxID=2908210 RepID=UPI001F236997|nr:endonuclease/exonuclease/phosphatase family protein [Antarcticibacterium sp. 1MA-6-2]UJH90155.1 endonuclease/exonuclease/phosphatase family protein [Antarcticibacterium sp. 1MA-6-2]